MRKIRILYAIPNFDTAATGSAMLKLANSLNKDLFEPMIVCLHDRGAFFEEVKRSGIPVYIYPYLSKMRPLYRLCWNIIRTARFFRGLKPDIIFSYNYVANYSESIAARLAGSKYMYIKKNMGWFGSSHNAWRINTLLASAITVQNKDMLKQFYKGKSKARLISLGVDTSEFKPKPPVTALKKEFGIPDTDKVVVCVANIIPKKGIEYLLQGFSECKSRDKSVLLIVGEDKNPHGMFLHGLKDSLGLGDRAIFTGKRHDINDILSIADLFILPSTGNEGAPVAIQEAMASGILVVSTDTNGNREQLDELPDQLIPIKDHQAVSISIDRFLELPSEIRERIIHTQHRIIEERYTLELEVKLHENLYLDTIRRKHV